MSGYRISWNFDFDKRLVTLAKSGLSRDEIATRMTADLGIPFTEHAIHCRVQRLRAEGVMIPTLQRTGTSASVRQTRLDQLNAISGDVDDNSSGALYDDEDADLDPKTPPEADVLPLIKQIVELTAKKALSFEDVCDALELPPSKTRVIVAQAQAAGYRIDFVGGQIGARPHAESLEEHPVEVASAGESHIIAVVGDVHFASKHHMSAQFQDFCRIAYSRGVRCFLQVGDLLDGGYSHSMWERSAHGFDDQTAVAIRDLPFFPDATWHFIQGNHDETLGEKSGLDVGRAIEQAFRAAGRTDLVYHGARGAYLRLKSPEEERGLLVHLWHPRDKANAYALSYPLQKRIEGYPVGGKPNAVFAGHWHQSLYLHTRGVHAISSGCWQGGQSAFGKSLRGAPSIGSWIVEYALTKGGTVRSFKAEWISYMEVETIREVGLG